eukprot:GHVR01003086.1.p2 GENE.GHVR01003086.1~~GHVR01003086.1.p2  ORF type:complete len:107 (+),score=5.50 GHVR01003086.1:3069-3389(+)
MINSILGSKIFINGSKCKPIHCFMIEIGFNQDKRLQPNKMLKGQQHKDILKISINIVIERTIIKEYKSIWFGGSIKDINIYLGLKFLRKNKANLFKVLGSLGCIKP